MKNRTRRCLALFLSALMAFSTVFGGNGVTARAEGETGVVAEWSYDKAANMPQVPVAATTGTGVINAVGSTSVASTAKGATQNAWSVGSYWEIAFDATGYANLLFTASLSSSKTGPAQFQLSASADGVNFANVGEVVTVTTEKPTVKTFDKVALPEGTSYLRISVAGSGAMRNLEEEFQKGGTNGIYNVCIEGTPSGTPIIVTPACEEVFAGKGSRTVLIGEEVDLHTNTEGASIYYSLNGAEYALYEAPIAIVSDSVIETYAAKEGLENSKVNKYEFKIAKVANVKAAPAAGSVNKGTEVTLSCDTEDAVIFYSYDGENFSEYTEAIKVNNDITVYAKAEKERMLASDVSVFAYTAVVPQGMKLDTVNDGDSFVMVHKASGSVLSTTASGAKLKGVESEITDGTLKVVKNNDNAAYAETFAVLTANVNENGQFTFTSKDGKFLTSNPTGSGLSFKDEANEYSLWNVVKTDEGEILIGNVNAKYTDKNGNVKDQYIEYYNGLYTTYSYAAGGKTTDFAVDLYTVPAVADKTVVITDSNKLSEVKSGDTFAVYGVRDGMILTNTAAGKKLAGIAASLDGEDVIVEKTEENADAVAAITVLKATEVEAGVFTLTNQDGKFLTTSATGNSMAFVDVIDDYSYWTFEKSSNNAFLIGNKNAAYVKNDVATPQYFEYYSGFTAYSFTKGTTAEAAYEMNLYKEVTIKDGSTVSGDDEYYGNQVKDVKAGDVLVLTIGDQVLSVNASGSTLAAIAAKADEKDYLEAPDAAAFLEVVDAGEGFVAFREASSGKFLTSGPTGSALSFADELTGLGMWKLEKADSEGYYVMNKDAKYNNTSSQYLEFYKSFTTYSMKTPGPAYLVKFYACKLPVLVDDSITVTIAKWAGTVTDNDIKAQKVYGDLYVDGDKLDEKAEYTVVKNGKPATVQSANAYMGAQNLGGENTYAQFKLSSDGYANIDLSFRIRATGAAAGTYRLAYSTDGENFANFTTGTVKCSWTAYNSEGSSQISKEADITDGVLKLFTDSQYHEVTFDVPAGAANAENLYVRLYPEGGKMNGSTGAVAGNIRLDTVRFVANPVIDSNRVAFVKAEPTEGAIAVGSALTLSTRTEGATIYYSVNGGEYQVYDAANKPAISELPATYSVYAVKEGMKNSIVLSYSYTQAKCDPPKANPNGGAVRVGTMLKLSALTEGASVFYKYSEEGEWIEYTAPIALNELPCTMYLVSMKDGYIDSEVKTLNFTEKSGEKYNIYFGQIHSHTNFSDGAGDCEEAFAHATQVANLDFLAVTDHSNSLDNAANGDITKNIDASAEDEWTKGHELAKKYSSDKFTCLYGYEMTWSNGLGHMNTFNTPGFQSRTQSAYSTYATALDNYYTALEKVPDSSSMFNHPGTTFGDFQDFAYYSVARDEVINLIEVGNGEGAIGSSGYFPSYEYYTRALDKGWHVAPANNQDNHKGKWGDANTARTVMLADTNSEAEIYQAMKDHRIYASEDNNLDIYYTLNGFIMGSILAKEDVDSNVDIKVELNDRSGEKLGKVQVIVNGGLVADQKTLNGSEETVEFSIPADYSYYYIKVVEADGDIAVTAPVWVGEVEACGLNGVSTETVLPVAGESLDIHVDFFNNEKVALDITSIKIESQDAEGVVTTVAELTGDELAAYMGGSASIGSNKTGGIVYNYVYNAAGKVNYLVSATATLAGVEKAYSGKLAVNYTAPQMVADVIIDGTHFNDYVAGYYAGNMGNFIKMCAENSLRGTVVYDKITADTLKNAKLLVLAAPSGRTGTTTMGDYTESVYDDEFINVVKEYVANGGSVIVCGIADYNNYHAAAQQNKLLEAIGSTIRINSDEIMDDTNNGGQTYRLYPEKFDMTSPFLAGVIDKNANPENFQVYSQYSGCSVDVSNAVATDFVSKAEKLVEGFDTTYSVDCKDENGKSYGNNIVNDNKGDITFLAHQTTAVGGDIFVAGGVFISDFEVKAELDNNDSLPYANYTIAKNIIDKNKVVLAATPIAEVRKGATGDVFAVEGYVTNGTDNEFTTFFDTIYIQDETAGIDIFPYSEAGLAIGTKVRIIGYVASYQGDMELKVISSEILADEPKVIEPEVVSTKDAMDYANRGGSLLKTTGVVTRTLIENGALSEFWIKDASGEEAAIFIDGYIYSATTGKNELADFVKEGATVSAVGVLYMHPEGDSDVSVPVFRVRNCDEIKLEAPVILEKNGIVEEDGVLYYYENDKRVYAGLIQIGDDFYYVQGGGIVSTGSYYITHGNDIMDKGHAQFGPDGKMILNGIVKIRGEYYYYENSRPVENLGLIFWNQYHYYIGEGGKAMTGMVDVVKANGIVNEGIHEFGEDGKMVLEGIIMINGKLRYYVGGAMRSQAGMIKIGDDMYYVGASAEVATGWRSVGSRHNNLVEPGMHYFDEVTGKFIK